MEVKCFGAGADQGRKNLQRKIQRRFVAGTIAQVGAAYKRAMTFPQLYKSLVLDRTDNQLKMPNVLRRSQEKVLAAVFSGLEVLELEAARLMVIAKTNSEEKVLLKSASLVYKTVAALREDVKALRNIDAAAGN